MTKRRPDMLSNMPHGTNVNLVFNFYSFSCNDALKNRNNLAAIHIIITNAITLPGHFHRQRQGSVMFCSHIYIVFQNIYHQPASFWPLDIEIGSSIQTCY